METTANKVTPLFQVRDFSFSYPEEETKVICVLYCIYIGTVSNNLCA